MEIDGLDTLTPESPIWDMNKILQNGLNFEQLPISKPAKHMETFCNQTVDFLNLAGNEWHGTQIVRSFDYMLAPFLDEATTDKQIKQALQSMFYRLMIPQHLGTKPNNILFTTGKNAVKWRLLHSQVTVKGKKQDKTYQDLEKEAYRIEQIMHKVLKSIKQKDKTISITDKEENTDILSTAIINTEKVEGYNAKKEDFYVDMAIRALSVKETHFKRMLESEFYKITQSIKPTLQNACNRIIIKRHNKTEDIIYETSNYYTSERK